MSGLATIDSAPLQPSDRAAAVARGVCRLFYRMGWAGLCEVPLGNGRRADVLALAPDGAIAIVEIKCSRADLLGDAKWTDYLGHCDQFYWAAPAGFELALFEDAARAPDRAGLIVADGHDAAILRAAAAQPMPPARRRAETLRFARASALRLLRLADPWCDAGG